MTDPLFRSAHDALVFAFNYSGQQYGKSPMIRITGAPMPSGKGLSGVDGAAQAGFIRAEVAAMGRIPEAILIARFAPHRTPHDLCSCPNCDGNHPNKEWTDAIMTLAQHIEENVLTGCSTNWDMRMQYVQRHFLKKGERENLKAIAARNDRHSNTVSEHNALVKRFFEGEMVFVEIDGKRQKRLFPGAEPRARSEIEGRLIDSGMVAS